MKTKSATEIVYVDEAGYGEVGQRFQAAVFGGGIIPPPTNLLKSGKRSERVSWMAALKQGQLFAPMTFAGSCNRDLFEMWLEAFLLPQLPAGDVIVIANASFHHSQYIDQVVAAAGCELWYLPPYFPRNAA